RHGGISRGEGGRRLQRGVSRQPSLRAKRSNPLSDENWIASSLTLLAMTGPLSPQRALRVHIECVDRLARGHEQAVALQFAKIEIGAALAQRDPPGHDVAGR